VEDAEQVVIQDDSIDTQRSEPVRDLLSKVGGLFACHRDQTQRRPRGASQACESLLGCRTNAVHRLADACCCWIPATGAAVAVRAASSVDHDGPGAGATGIDCEKHNVIVRPDFSGGHPGW
jgi:hypothetical protein